MGHFYLIGSIFLKLGANVLVEFENVFFNLGHFFPNWGQMCLWNLKKKFKLGAMGANVLVDFENVFLIGAFFKFGANVLVEFD